MGIWLADAVLDSNHVHGTLIQLVDGILVVDMASLLVLVLDVVIWVQWTVDTVASSQVLQVVLDKFLGQSTFRKERDSCTT